MSARAEIERVLAAADPWRCVERRLDDALAAADASDARRAASAPLGPLDGVPFAVKANLDVRGVPTTAGTAVERPPAERDAAAVALLRAAGAIPAITTSTAEAAIGSVTVNPWTGPCASPPDPGRNAGGSSGGSAAAVAAGLVPFALGSDTMGSVRIPAACCGVAGWKPTRGAVSTEGLVPLAAVLDTVGVLAPTARDLLPVARLLLGSVGSGSEEIGGPIALVRTAVGVDADADAAVASTRRALTELGHDVVEVDLDLDAALVRRRGLLLCESEAWTHWCGPDGELPAGLSPAVAELLRFGRDASAEKLAAARAARLDVEDAVGELLGRVEALLLPTLPGGAPALTADPVGLADLTAFVNLAGVPAVSVPTSHVAEGERVPRSVQLVGRPGSDVALLDLAAAVTDRA